jgi:hypothetical protein
MTSANARFNDAFALAYGSITVLGGIIGYLKAGSVASYCSIPNLPYKSFGILNDGV